MDNTIYNPAERMDHHALTLAIISIISFPIIYLSIPCGALSIILGFLSRNGSYKFKPRATYAIWISVIGILLCLTIYGLAFGYLYWKYESLSAISDALQKTQGMSFEEIYNFINY